MIKFFKVVITALVFLVMLERKASVVEVLLWIIFVIVIWEVKFFKSEY